MNKLLLPALAAVIAVTSCNINEQVYTISNVNNYLNYKEGVLFNDVGLTLNVVNDLTDGKWKIEGNRFLGTFDVLNINYDIALKSYVDAIIQDVELMPDVEEEMHGDPVSIIDCSLSGIYLNLVIGFYVKTGSECPHHMHLYYSDDKSTLSLVLIHEGDNEIPANKDESGYTVVKRLYCFPIYDLVMPGEKRSVTLAIDALGVNEDGAFVSQPYTSSVYGGLVTF